MKRAKADGSWDRLAYVESLVVPDDLQALLDANRPAKQNFETFPRSRKRAILEWIAAAKTTPTRQRRLEETVADAALGRRANQYRQAKSAED